jgi:hypothetical protein
VIVVSSVAAANEPRDWVAEALAHLGDRGVGVLDEVVEDSGGDEVIVVAGAAEQLGDLERMQDERRLVAAPLVCMHVVCPFDRCSCRGPREGERRLMG